MNVKEFLDRKQCPVCWTKNIEVTDVLISCPVCGLRGNPRNMRWCEHVPVFRKIKAGDDSGRNQLYKYRDDYYIQVGTFEGCGREIGNEGYCTYCREFMPELTDDTKVKRGRASSGKTARAPIDGKSFAAGDKESD